MTATTPLFASAFATPRPNPEVLVSDAALVPGDVPLTLLPVRVETRFFRIPDNIADLELRVRIYPDSLHVDTHQPELTTDERTVGIEYWQQDWRAATDMTARADAWRTLANRHGARRAAWIARVLTPTNLAQRPGMRVPDRETPAVQPLFPTLPPVGVGGESTWRHAPQARLLPDRWHVVLHAAGRVAIAVTGASIKRPLAVGPDPLAPEPAAAIRDAIIAGEQTGLDPDMQWMVDFDAAEALGMALRIPVQFSILQEGIDSLLVFGVATSISPSDAASQMADLLDAHHYTDGLELLRYGTPTNNTDDRRAGFSTADAGHVRSFVNEVTPDLSHVPNAVRVGALLGLPAERVAPTLGHLGRAGDDHELDARSMNTALWSVGWGYYLSNMIGAETGLTTATVDWARRLFVDHVRSGGPLPTLRCGPQPYGILPVTSLDDWTPATGDGSDTAPREAWLKHLLMTLRDGVWRPVAAQVARVGLRPDDPDADLADVMRTDGVSHQQFTRRVVGRHYLEHLYSLAAQDFTGVAQAQDAVSARLLTLMGLPSQGARRPHVAHAFFEAEGRPVSAPLVQAGEVSPWRMLESPNFIGALLAAGLDAPAPDATASLLHALLHHAMRREMVNAAARLAATNDSDLAALLRDSELVDLVDVALVDFRVQPTIVTPHWKRLLALATAPGTGGATIHQFLQGLTDFTASSVSQLGEFRAALAHLQGLDSETLQHLLSGTLDLSAHRLDAWVTSFATSRLATMSSSSTDGQAVGAYGWVENLRPDQDASPVPPASMPAGEQQPLFHLAGDRGFIHAPSLTHASTAALLRNAALGPSGAAQVDGPFAIDLSSRRVREAARLLDGVRHGQPLGALLGYRVERRLHELELDRCIGPLRALAPLLVRERETNDLPTEALAANNVVDALMLLRRWRDEGTPLLTSVLQNTDVGVVEGELVALHDAVDGLSDALTAETAYQMVRGNTSRLASTLAAIAEGDALPPELEVARMPRTGNSITHRVVTLMSGRPQTAAGWLAVNSSVLASIERSLNAWVSRLLGDARKVRCTVERLDDVTGAVVQTVTFPLSDVPMSQLDFVYGVEVGGAAHPQVSSSSTVEQQVLYVSRRRPDGFGAETNLRIQHARPDDLAVGELTLFDLIEQARSIRHLLASARGLRPDDLAPPGRSPTGTVDVVDLQGRVERAENALNAAHKRLVAELSASPATGAEELRIGLLALSACGLAGAVPSVAVGDTPEIRQALARQAGALLDISGARLAQGASLRTQAAADDERARVDQLLERAQTALGAMFVMLPTFTCDAADAAELGQALAASTRQQGGDPLAVHTWFTRCTRVRDTAARLGACLRDAEVLGAIDRLALSVAQLPFVDAERWVGLPALPGSELAPSKLSVVVQSALPLDTALPLAGLYVDEWVEVVPSESETTALTFQFDPPNSFAPQNILVAVPPVLGVPWTTESLWRVLVETLDLVKLRAVDPSLLGAAAQYLPALFVPFNAADDAVSTDFAPLTA